MALYSRILQQLGHPEGLLGRLILNRLNAVNASMNRLSFTNLALHRDDTVLEIGFGGGALLRTILDAGRCRKLCGVDRSELAVNRARRHFAPAIEAGKLELKHCTDQRVPYPDSIFDTVCCVNVIYFWSDIPAQLKDLHRLLNDNGRLVLSYSEGSPDRISTFPKERVEAWLLKAGFKSASSSSDSDKENGTYHCTVAVR